ncbi:MAG: hypothetical protein ABII82_10605 [Verrucomicrobiota bacterium]
MKRLSWFTAACAIALSVLFSGCGSTSEKDYPVSVPRFLIEADGDEVGINVRLPLSGVLVRVKPKSIITEYDITNAQVVQSDLGAAVMFQLTSQAARDLYRLSATNQGRRILTTVNGEALAASRMDTPIGEGVIVSYLEIPPELLPELVENINKTCRDLQKELDKQKK